MKRFVALALSAAILPSAVHAEPLELKPASQWNLSYDQEACRLGRAFGEGDDQVLLRFVRYLPESDFETLVSGKDLEPRGSSFQYRFGPVDEPDKVENLLYGQNDEGVTTWQFKTDLFANIDYKDLDLNKPDDRKLAILRQEKQVGEVDSFDIVKGVKQPVSLKLGSLTAAMEAMDTCMDDLVRTWGFDPEAQRRRLSPPEPTNNKSRWIQSSDFPPGPLRKNFSGSVRFRLTVDETGAITDCIVQQSYSDPAFREATCKTIESRARFSPAIGADGAPIKSFWGTSVVFVAPR